MATQADIQSARASVDDLRAQIEARKVALVVESDQASVDVQHDALLAEEARLKAELAALNGEAAPEVPTVDGYEVPMGTVSVDTDVVSVEDPNAPVDPDAMKKDELLDKAKEVGAPVDPTATKADIAATINDTLAAGEASQEG